MPNNDSKKPEPVKETKGSYIPPPNAIKPSQPEEEQMKDLTVTSIADAQIKVPDIQVVGNGDSWQIVCAFLFAPFGIWKVIELITWVVSHVSVNIQ